MYMYYFFFLLSMLYCRSILFRWQEAFCFDWLSWGNLYLWQIYCRETEEKLSTKCIVRVEEHLYSFFFTMMGLRGKNPSCPSLSPLYVWHIHHFTEQITENMLFIWQHFLHHRHGALLRARQMVLWTCAVGKTDFSQSQDVSIWGIFHEWLVLEIRLVNEYYWNIIQMPCVYTVLHLTQLLFQSGIHIFPNPHEHSHRHTIGTVPSTVPRSHINLNLAFA